MLEFKSKQVVREVLSEKIFMQGLNQGKSDPCRYMGEEHEKQKEQQVQGFERSPLPPACLKTIRELVWRE